MEDIRRSPDPADIESLWRLSVKDIFPAVDSRPEGLTDAEAQDRLRAYGRNVIQKKKKQPAVVILLKNFISTMAILLWVGGVIAFIARMPELGFAIWLVNIINGVFSFWQEFRATKATEALQKMLASYSHVIRGGEEKQIPADELVPGDIMIIAEGDKISADARLLFCEELQVNQSTLTGESNPVRKTAEAVLRDGLSHSEIPNLVFAGTTVSNGNGKALVISTGMNTMFGKIASLTQTMRESQSPLQKELDLLTKQVSVMALSLGALFFLIAVLLVHNPVAESFIFALGMIVAFIPEGLLPTVTLALAMAVQRMVKEHALVKRLSAVETLGCTSVICSDKTGTLTQNEMTVCNLWLPDGELDVTGIGYAPEGEILRSGNPVKAKDNQDLALLLTAASLCSNARIVPPKSDGDSYVVLGDPTEACLGVAAQKAGIDCAERAAALPRLRELPFDSRRKRMTTIHQPEDREKKIKRIAFVKGAPKEVLDLCTMIHSAGDSSPLSAEERARIMQANDQYARNGLRVLAVAYRALTDEDGLPAALSAYTPEIVEQNLVFVGLVVMSDPPRPEVANAVALCHAASIRIIMITGDYGLTAESIARRIGIVSGDQLRVISGMELEALSDSELKIALKGEVIFARVAPEQKYRVVNALQEMGEIVAVTGDGVNDAPALKKADIGVAMGISGTDVAKEAADMILTDDNFASIVRAIEEGRGVYNNIKKFLLYILNSNMPEAAPSVLFLLSRGFIPLPLTVMQILTIDLGTDMLPALGLGTEAPEKGVMDHPPRARSDKLLNRKLFIKAFLWYGIIESVVSICAYFYVNYLNGWPGVPLAASGFAYCQATTMTLASIVFCQIGMVLNCRTEMQSVFRAGIFSNKRVIIGILFEVLLLSAIVYVPFLQNVFNTAPLGLRDWFFLALIPIPIVLLEEGRKYLNRIKIANRNRRDEQ